MHVLVELFDQDPLKNVLGPCVFAPDVVVFLCDERDATFFKESAVLRLLRRRRLKTQARFLYFDASEPGNIRRVLNAVVRDYPGCVFDFSGGHNLILLVAGAAISEMKLPGYYVHLPNGRFVNIQGCETLATRFVLPSFSAEDIFTMAGASIEGHGHFSTAEMDGTFEEMVLRVFGIVRQNPKAWSTLVSFLQGLIASAPQGSLSVQGPRNRRHQRANAVVLQKLRDAGALTELDFSDDRITLRFASPLHRKCLLIEGIWLELYCYVLAKRSGAFDDVRTSIVVDWDGVEGGTDNTKNEVDVFLVKGIAPVFISCKMNVPSALALSEIRLLATKFGGSQARAVMLCAATLGNNHRALRMRAADLGIYLLDGAYLETPEALLRVLADIAQPQHQPDAPRLASAKMLPPAP